MTEGAKADPSQAQDKRCVNPTYAELGGVLGNAGSCLTEETPLTYRSKKPFKIP